MITKQNFNNGDRVIIYRLGDGKEYTGTIRGFSHVHIVDTYIVETDGRPFENYPFDCIGIVESCLKPLS